MSLEWGRAVVVPVLLGVAVAACGDSTSTAPAEPSPAPGRWLGAQTIDGAPPTLANCNGAIAPITGMDASDRAVATWLSDCAIAVAGTSQGQPWSPPSPLGGLPPGAPANWLWDPALAVNHGGIALVAWATQESAAEGRQLVSRRLDPVAGWTSAERIDGGEARRLGLPYAPSLALDDAGNGLAVWNSEGVVAARLSVARGWLAPERSAGPPSSVPFVFLDGRGGGFATWSLRGEAYARRFEPAGAGVRRLASPRRPAGPSRVGGTSPSTPPARRSSSGRRRRARSVPSACGRPRTPGAAGRRASSSAPAGAR